MDTPIDLLKGHSIPYVLILSPETPIGALFSKLARIVWTQPNMNINNILLGWGGTKENVKPHFFTQL